MFCSTGFPKSYLWHTIMFKVKLPNLQIQNKKSEYHKNSLEWWLFVLFFPNQQHDWPFIMLIPDQRYCDDAEKRQYGDIRYPASFASECVLSTALPWQNSVMRNIYTLELSRKMWHSYTSWATQCIQVSHGRIY